MESLILLSLDSPDARRSSQPTTSLPLGVDRGQHNLTKIPHYYNPLHFQPLSRRRDSNLGDNVSDSVSDSDSDSNSDVNSLQKSHTTHIDDTCLNCETQPWKMAPSSLSVRTTQPQPQPVASANNKPPVNNSSLGQSATADSLGSRGKHAWSQPRRTAYTASTVLGTTDTASQHPGSKIPSSTSLAVTNSTNASIPTPPAPKSASNVVTTRRAPPRNGRKDSTSTAGAKDHVDDGSAKPPGMNNSQPATSPASSPTVTFAINPGVDPLSQHIFKRTNTDPSLAKPSRLRNPTAVVPESPVQGLDPLPRQSSELGQPASGADAARDKKKGPSLLSRLGIRKTRTEDDSIPDDASEFSNEPRMNGADARVFSSIVDAGGFVPHHKEPPRYIRVRAQHKKDQHREFNRMFLAQELVGTHPKQTEDGEHTDEKAPVVTVSVAGAGGRRREKTGGAIWATEFSKDGKYLAAAGKDGVVRVWAVISTPEERRSQEEEEAAVRPVGERLSAPVFLERPIREFLGHTNEVVDLSWSKNNFLLSTSMDKTVRLWHLSREECLCQFKHKDVVTKVAFHPTDDRFFLAGCLDMNLRLWSIPDKQVAWNVTLPDLITAVAFTPDGKIAIAGLLNGMCMLYETEGLKFHSQIHAKSSRGKNSKGSKITGISTMAMPLTSGGNGTEPGEIKIMISTNDSRIRVYDLRDGSLDTKFKGHTNACTQISASFSDDAQYVISGSENRKAFIWKTGSTAPGDSNKDKHPCENFDAHGNIVTTALFAPKATRQLLSGSGDPIYDLCNPPPVVLMSADEAAASASQAAVSDAGSQEPQAPGMDKSPTSPNMAKKVEYSPAYLSRTAHPGGNIIVTTDDQGILKIFRQDCAHGKRRVETWETASNLSRRRNGVQGSGVGRTSSMRSAQSSAAAHSRRGSVSTGPPTGKLSSDMILSWRQDVEGGRPNSIASSIMSAPVRSERSLSPAKANVRRSNTNLAAGARMLPYSATSPRIAPTRMAVSDVPDSPTSSVASRRRPKTALDMKKGPTAPLQLEGRENDGQKEKPGPSPLKAVKDAEEEKPMGPPLPSFTLRSVDDGQDDVPAKLDAAGGGYGFWNLNRWKGLSGLKGSSGGGAGGTKKHQRTTSEAVLEGTGSHAMPGAGGDEGPRRKSLGSPASMESTAASSQTTPTLAGDDDDSAHLRAKTTSIASVLS